MSGLHAPGADSLAQRLELVLLSGVEVWLRGRSGEIPGAEPLVSALTIATLLLGTGEREATLRPVCSLKRPSAGRRFSHPARHPGGEPGPTGHTPPVGALPGGSAVARAGPGQREGRGAAAMTRALAPEGSGE
jgi:hypothetical protein